MCIFVIITVLADGLAPTYAGTSADTIECREFADKVVTKYRSHYSDVIMGTIRYQMTSLAIVYSTVYSGADQRKQQSSASLAVVRGIHRWPVNFPAQMASNAENVSIWLRLHAVYIRIGICRVNQ